MKKTKTILSICISLLLIPACVTLAFARQPDDTAQEASLQIQASAPAVSAEPSATDEGTFAEQESDGIPTEEIYSPDKVILSSTAWDKSLGECVTGEFETLADALNAAYAEQSLYYPAWDAGHVEAFGDACLILLHNPVSVLDITTGSSTMYPSLQFNYHTGNINHFKITVGREDLSVPDTEYETYAFGEYTFYLTDFSYQSGGVNAYATIDGNYYFLSASSAEDAKRLIDSLVLSK